MKVVSIKEKKIFCWQFNYSIACTSTQPAVKPKLLSAWSRHKFLSCWKQLQRCMHKYRKMWTRAAFEIPTNKLLRRGAFPFSHIVVQPFNNGGPIKRSHGVGLCHGPRLRWTLTWIVKDRIKVRKGKKGWFNKRMVYSHWSQLVKLNQNVVFMIILILT